ncbi:MAG: type II and III secretion system protein [bacterium]|nr:type II and III secretion system protein [bacterium]
MLCSIRLFLFFIFLMFIVKNALAQDIFLFASNADIKDVLIIISKVQKKNIIVSPDITGKVSLRIRTSFENLKKILEDVAGISFVELEGNLVVVPKSKFRGSRIVKLRFYPPKNIVDAISQIGVRTSLIHTNIIFLEGEEEKINIAEKVIQEIDRIPKQVLIEAKIVELTTRGAYELGNFLKFAAGDFEGGFNFSGGKAQIMIGTEKIEYIIGMLEQKGEAKTLSSPKILTTDGEKAEIRQGISVPYDVSTQFAINTLFYDAFLSLEVTPKVSDDKKIVLELKISKNFPTFEVVSARGIPSISRNEILSKIIVQEKETVGIGGIIIETNGESYEGVPILSSVPIIGFLFKNYKRSKEKREIAVFLTPSILE